MTTALALGTFDLIHPGHVRFLRAAGSISDRLVVAVNTDDFAARFKRRPVMSLDERMEMLHALSVVDEVIVNTGCEDSRPAILASGATVVVHGDDWTGADYMRQLGVTRPWLEEHRVEIRYVPYTAGISTSDIIARVERDSGEAKQRILRGWDDHMANFECMDEADEEWLLTWAGR